MKEIVNLVFIRAIRGNKKKKLMKRDIILAGVGGQGILSIATVIGDAALNEGLYLKQAEVHGMSQRGGDVQSNLRLSSEPIYSDLIPKGGADLIISLEPMEALRYLPYLKPEGWIVSNSKPFVNIPNYPEIEEVLSHVRAVENHVLLDVETLAKEAGAPAQAANMVLLGAAIPMLGIDHDKIIEGVKRIFERKGEAVVASNIAAIEAGYNASREL
jgi:indolepyruvate ferredoxin oxidoreductase beta subunit